MANYLDYAGLQKYDAKIKEYLKNLDAEILNRGVVKITKTTTGLPTGIAARYTLSQDVKYESKTSAGTFITYAEYQALVEAYKADQKKTTPTLPDPATLYDPVSVDLSPAIDIPDGVDLTAIETAIGKDEAGNLIPVTTRIKNEAKDATYKAETSEGTGDAVTIGAAIKALEDEGFLNYKGTATAEVTTPVDGDLYYFNIAATESTAAVKGWKFYSSAETAWKDLNDATLADRVSALETQVGKDKTVTTYVTKTDLVDIVNVLTSDVTTEGSVLKAVYDNAQDAKYGTETYIAEYELITDPTQKITVEAYNALSEADKALYQAVNKQVTIKKAIENMAAAGAVTISDTTTETGYLKTYTFSQNGAEIGKVNIPKDFLVKSGKITEFTKDEDGKYYQDGVEIEALPSGVTDTTLGKYIELVINTTDGTGNETKVYIYVKDLVDIYTVAANATEVQLAINANNEISATLVDAVEPAEGVTAAGITTAKIRDKQITLGKLSQEVQDMLQATGGALVYKNTVAAVPTTGKLGDLYKVGTATTGYKTYVCTTASVADPATDAVYTEIAIDEAFLTAVVGTGYEIAQPGEGAAAKAVTVKEYIDSRIFVGTQAEVDAAKAAGTIDNTAFVVVTDEDAEELTPISNTEIDSLFD